MPVQYAEMRWWARLLGVFTERDIADAMGTPVEVGEQACRALTFHGIVVAAGEWEEHGESVRVFEYLPLPPGPREHPTKTPPEIIAARSFGMEIFDRRGVPVRLVDEKQARRLGSVPGNRHKLRLRQRRYEAMEEAKVRRRTKAKARRELDRQRTFNGNGRRNGNGSGPDEWVG